MLFDLAETHLETRLLLWRLYYLQFLIEEMHMDPDSRHYLWLYLDQHLPWLDAVMTRKHNVPYHEVTRFHLLPDCVEVMCDETVCRNAIDLQEILAPCSSKRPNIVQLILKTLPKRCICRNMEERALEEFLTTPILPKIFRWMILGNTRCAVFRPPLYARLRVWRADNEKLLQIAQKSARTMTFALASFTSVVVEELGPFWRVMSRQTSWKSYWRNINLVCDCVIRPAFAKGRCVAENEIEQWQKKSSKPLSSITKVTKMRSEQLYKELRENYKRRFGVTPKQHNTLRLCIQSVTVESAQDSLLSVISNPPSCEMLDQIFREDVFPREMVKSLADDLSEVQLKQCIDRLLAFNTSHIFSLTYYLKPLPVYFHAAQGKTDEKVYRICPVCFGVDFLIMGLKQTPATFRIEPHTWNIICESCRCNTVVLQMRGNMLVTPSARILCCTKCASPCSAKTGAFRGSDRCPFLCQKCM